MNNTGQCCVAAKRFILDEKIADTFLGSFKAEFEKLVPGDPMDARTTLGPLCTVEALNLVQKQIKDAIDGGATVLMGDTALAGRDTSWSRRSWQTSRQKTRHIIRSFLLQ